MYAIIVTVINNQLPAADASNYFDMDLNFSLITGKNTVRQNHLKVYKYFIEPTVCVIHNYAHAYTLIVIIC